MSLCLESVYVDHELLIRPECLNDFGVTPKTNTVCRFSPEYDTFFFFQITDIHVLSH